MVKSCIFSKCLNNSNSKPELSFHPFVKPSLEPERAKKWLEIAGREDLSLEKINKHSYVCHVHFLPNLHDYNWLTNKALQPVALKSSLEEAQIDYFKNLVETLDPDTVLKCVAKKLFDAFSIDDLETELNSLGLDGKRNLFRGKYSTLTIQSQSEVRIGAFCNAISYHKLIFQIEFISN